MSPPLRLSRSRSLLLAIALVALARSAHAATPPGELPFVPEQHRPQPHASLPSCPKWHMAVLPPRELFERPMGLLQNEAIVAAWHHTGAVAFQTAEYPITAPVPAAQRKEPAPPAGARRALPGFEMQVEIDASSGAPRIVDAWGSSVGLAPWGNDLRTFVDVNRSIFGVPADRRVRVVFADGHRDDVELQYPNGAVSEGGLGAETPGDSAHGPELVDGPDHRFRVRNRLPPVSPAFSALPTLSAEDAVARFVLDLVRDKSSPV